MRSNVATRFVTLEKSILALKKIVGAPSADPCVRAYSDRLIKGLRKAGLPEE